MTFQYDKLPKGQSICLFGCVAYCSILLELDVWQKSKNLHYYFCVFHDFLSFAIKLSPIALIK